MNLTIDFNKVTGKIKPMHGVGQGPLVGTDTQYFHYLKDAHIPYARLHDVGGWFGGNMWVDIPNIFRDFDAAKRAYEPFVKRADIVKFSEDELLDFTGISGIDAAAESLCDKDKLILVTLGKNGSAYYFNGEKGVVPSEYKCKSVDTTGAGDAFFGAFLAAIENKKPTKENIVSAMRKGNEKGAKTTEFFGAIKL